MFNEYIGGLDVLVANRAIVKVPQRRGEASKERTKEGLRVGTGPAILQECFQVAICHWSHYDGNILPIRVASYEADQVPVRQALETLKFFDKCA
jgi:hypothetical protein